MALPAGAGEAKGQYGMSDDDRTGFEREYLPGVEGWAGWLGVAFAAFGTFGFPLVLYWLLG